MTMLNDQAHMATWLIYLIGVGLGVLVLNHFLQVVRRPFVRVLCRSVFIGLLVAPVATDPDRFYFAPAIMQAALSAMAGKYEPMEQALVSMAGVTLLALFVGIAYYLQVFLKKKRAQ
ncbi:MAG: hypothetical protein RL336_834 [Pseudomonadota bacterium]|jgi:hypothetical protein